MLACWRIPHLITASEQHQKKFLRVGAEVQKHQDTEPVFLWWKEAWPWSRWNANELICPSADFFLLLSKVSQLKDVDFSTLARSKIYAHDWESCSNIQEEVYSALANVLKTPFGASYTMMQFQVSQRWAWETIQATSVVHRTQCLVHD